MYSEFEPMSCRAGAAKALDDATMRIGGYLVLFGSADEPDLQREYFDGETDLGPTTRGRVRIHHGGDKALGICPVGEVDWEQRDEGIWCEGVVGIKALDARRWAKGIEEKRGDYERAIYQLVKDGKLGWSSSTVAHMIRTEPSKKAGVERITSWPLGDDCTLSWMPVDPRNLAVPRRMLPVKSLMVPGLSLFGDGPDGVKAAPAISDKPLGEFGPHQALMGAVYRLHDLATSKVSDHIHDTKKSLGQKMAGVKSVYSAVGKHVMNGCKSFLGDDADDMDSDDMTAAGKALIARFRDEGAASAPTVHELAEEAVTAGTALSTVLKRHAETRAAEGRSLSAPKLASMKAFDNVWRELMTLAAPAVAPDRLRDLHLRALALESELVAPDPD